MDFIIKKTINSREKLHICYCEKLSNITLNENQLFIERLPHLDYVELKENGSFKILMGDVIKVSENEYKGIYYTCTIINDSTLIILSDNHSLLPIYYANEGNCSYVSSSFVKLIKLLKKKTINPNFCIDLSIIYSNIGEDSYFKEIKRVKYGDKVVVDATTNVINTKRFFDNFVKDPITVKESISSITNLFIETSKPYFQGSCAITLTGGFDTRVNTGCAHYYNTDYISCSYGRKGNGDVENPFYLAKKLNLVYHLIELEEKYIQNEFYNSAIDSMKLSGGISGFHSPQTLYYAKEIRRLRNVLVTGYLGSEIFANPKGGNDEVISHVVIDFIRNEDKRVNFAFTILPLLVDLEIISNKHDIEDLLNRLYCYTKELPESLTKNQLFSTYNFENTFRNTFGLWIYTSMHYIKVRTPFIDKVFFDAVCNTRLSGFYRDFLENRLHKRMIGQKIYPNILEKTWPELNRLTSSKGYSPHDLMNPSGIIKLIPKYLWSKKIVDSQKYEIIKDNRSRDAGIRHYINNYGVSFEESYKKRLIQHMEKGSLLSKMYCLRSVNNKEIVRVFNI